MSARRFLLRVFEVSLGLAMVAWFVWEVIYCLGYVRLPYWAA
jgi:hypothetical protein